MGTAQCAGSVGRSVKALLMVPLLAVLAACGTTASREAPERTEYVLISEGAASAFYSLFAGDARYCKVTTHAEDSTPITYTADYNDGVCVVSVIKE